MNCVEIMGGLGNQLFQYTFSKYLQKLGIKNVVLRKDFFAIDFSQNEDMTKREFLLDKYNVPTTQTATAKIIIPQIINKLLFFLELQFGHFDPSLSFPHFGHNIKLNTPSLSISVCY